MNDHVYKKISWRINNLTFLTKVFGNTLNGSYIEMIGGHNPEDKAGKEEMFYLMKSKGFIEDDSQFIGADLDPVVLFRRKHEEPKLHTYPLIFGDIFSAIHKIQKSDGLVIDVRQQSVKVNPNVRAINFDTEKAARNPASETNKTEWWSANKYDLRPIVQRAGSLAIIANFTRDMGAEKGTTKDDRKNFIIEGVKGVFNRPIQGDIQSVIDSIEEYQSRTAVMMTARFLIKPNQILFYDKNGRTP